MVFCLVISFAVSCDVLVFSCGIWESIFASPSALSFMDISRMTWYPLNGDRDSMEANYTITGQDDFFDALCSIAMGVFYCLDC